MFLININNILSVWNKKFDIFKYLIWTFSLCNIGKDTFVYRTYGKNVYIRYRQNYLCLYCIWKCCLYKAKKKMSIRYIIFFPNAL